jgi:hypothetical protein
MFFFLLAWFFPNQYYTNPLILFAVLTALIVLIPLSVLWYNVFEQSGVLVGKMVIQKIRTHNFGLNKIDNAPTASRFIKPAFVWLFVALLAVAFTSYWINSKLTHPNPAENNNLAWTLSTDANAAKRNGSLAVRLAEDACHQTRFQTTIMVGTLAAAYAESGRFNDAISTAQKACLLATQSNDEALLKRNQDLLALYLSHQAFHNPN